MTSTVTCIEEIPRDDWTVVPQVNLKIVNLNLNDRGEVFTPLVPPRAGAAGDSQGGAGDPGALLPYAQPRAVVRRQLHKLQSYDHLLFDLHRSHRRGMGYTNRPHRNTPQGTHRGSESPAEDSDPQFQDDEESPYVFFMKGMNNIMCSDREKVLSTIVQLLNQHAVSVATNEYKLLGNGSPLPPKSTLNHVMVRGALHALNEILDQGVLDITRRGTVQVGQCLVFTLYFHKNLLKIGNTAWHSNYAQMIRDAWMSFGCVGAMVYISSMRN